MRDYETGARRSSNKGKIDYRGFISPVALRMFGAYMKKHQTCEDGEQRSSDNWKRGMPMGDYVESLTRHMIEFWRAIECGDIPQIEESICGIFFNTQGFMDLWAGGVDERQMEVERMWLGYYDGGPHGAAVGEFRKFLRRMRQVEALQVEPDPQIPEAEQEVPPERKVPRYENPVAAEPDPYEDRFLKRDPGVVITPPVEPKCGEDEIWQEWVPTLEDDPKAEASTAGNESMSGREGV